MNQIVFSFSSVDFKVDEDSYYNTFKKEQFLVVIGGFIIFQNIYDNSLYVVYALNIYLVQRE